MGGGGVRELPPQRRPIAAGADFVRLATCTPVAHSLPLPDLAAGASRSFGKITTKSKSFETSLCRTLCLGVRVAGHHIL